VFVRWRVVGHVKWRGMMEGKMRRTTMMVFNSAVALADVGGPSGGAWGWEIEECKSGRFVVVSDKLW
jgi:hypothetical protein